MNTEQYLRLTAYAIATDDGMRMTTENVDWRGYYQFCQAQAILGIGLQAIKKLKRCHGAKVDIPQALLLQWIGVAEMLRHQNAVVDKRVKELTEYLREQGQQSCILKGQGNAVMYPDFAMRTPGDIDVWVKGTKKEVASFVHQRFPEMNVQYHHMSYPIFNDIEVEIHYYPSFCYNKWHNYWLQRYFHESKEEQFENRGTDCYSVPTVAFNIIFQLSHMMRHFFTQGIGLRHAIDYYYLLHQDISSSEKQEALGVIKRCGMTKFLQGVMWIETSVFELDRNTDIAQPLERTGRLILQEMLNGGNFGRCHQSATTSSPLISVIRQMAHTARFLTAFPSEPLWRPVALTWDYTKKHLFTYG